MLNRNLIWVGLLIGLMLPSLLYVILLNLFSLLEIKGAASTTGLSQNFRERTLAIVALASNLWLMKTYHRRRQELSMRGVVVATTVLALIWLYTFGTKLF
ncbi:MAG: hypothetical protein ACKOCH_26805 [Bacteroidota bacterium]